MASNTLSSVASSLGLTAQTSQPQVLSVPAAQAAQTTQPAPVAQPTAAPQQQPSEEPAGKFLPQSAPEPADLSRIAENLNRFMQSSQRSLTFRVDEFSGRTIITVLNPETKEVVRQIPPDELLALARRITATSGSLFDAMA